MEPGVKVCSSNCKLNGYLTIESDGLIYVVVNIRRSLISIQVLYYVIVFTSFTNCKYQKHLELRTTWPRVRLEGTGAGTEWFLLNKSLTLPLISPKALFSAINKTFLPLISNKRPNTLLFIPNTYNIHIINVKWIKQCTAETISSETKFENCSNLEYYILSTGELRVEVRRLFQKKYWYWLLFS